VIHIRINTINILDRQLLGLYSHPCLILKDYGPKEQVHSISHTTNDFLMFMDPCIVI